ncbi:MAG: hypothetical protein ACYC5Y_00970 [Symbiobacteriia bacterium]
MQRQQGVRRQRGWGVLQSPGLARAVIGLLLLLALPGLTVRLGRLTSPRRAALAEWLISAQTADGALRNRPPAPDVTPYFASQAAQALVATPGGTSPARRYLGWYLAHLNRRDRYGLAGTIYDYHPKNPWPPGYDSADAYAATFLSLARLYVEETADWAWARENEAGLAAVGNLLVSLQDGDGLIRCGGPSDQRYLMDNAENYRGLVDWAWLLAGLGKHEQAAAVRYLAARLARGVNQVLWDPPSQAYRPASPPFHGAADPKANLPDWSKWYPDAAAQLFPSLYGMPQPQGRGLSLYRRLAQAFPAWTQGQTCDPYPWLTAGLAAWRLGQTRDARALLRYVEARYPADPRGQGWQSPTWHSGEAAAELGLRTALTRPGEARLWRFLNGSY